MCGPAQLVTAAPEAPKSPSAVNAESPVSLVPMLLDQMNASAAETNKLELHVSQAQSRYRQRLAHWSKLHKELVDDHGAKAVDYARRFFEAEEAIEESSGRIKAVLKELAVDGCSCSSTSTASSDGEGEEREEEESYEEAMARHQREHEAAVAAFSEALRSVEHWRQKAGQSRLKRILPSLRLLRAHAKRLDSEQERIAALSQKVRASKAQYSYSMLELERISNAIHEARAERAAEPKVAPESSEEEGEEAAHKSAAEEYRFPQEVEASPERVPMGEAACVPAC